MILYISLLFALLSTFQTSAIVGPEMDSQELLTDAGLELLKKHCYTCHNPNAASHDEIIAPPLFGIKNNYRKTFPEKYKFIEAMEGFINAPTEEKALMKGPVKRFGLMPKPAISPKEIKLIVDYLEGHELEKPKWYAAHHEK